MPIDSPRLDHIVYELILAHFLIDDRLLRTIKEWLKEIYNISAVIIAIRAELDKTVSTSSVISSNANADGGSMVLMECLAEL